MIKMPFSESDEGQETVAAFQMDLQMFADESVADGGGDVGSVDTGADSLGADESYNEGTESGDSVDSGVVDQSGDDDVPGEVKGQSAEANRAFAEMRKQKEAAEKAAQKARQDALKQAQAERDAWYMEKFGMPEKQYQALAEMELKNRQDKQRQEMAQLPQKIEAELISKGYDPVVAKGLAEVEAQKIRLNQLIQDVEVQKQQETKKQAEARKETLAKSILTDHEKLVKEFGEGTIPTLDSLDDATVQKMQRGYSLYDAWTTSNLDVVREHAKKVGEAKTRKNINSKAHLQSEKDGSGDFGTEVSLTADQLRVWKAMGYNEKEARKRAAKYAKRGK